MQVRCTCVVATFLAASLFFAITSGPLTAKDRSSGGNTQLTAVEAAGTVPPGGTTKNDPSGAGAREAGASEGEKGSTGTVGSQVFTLKGNGPIAGVAFSPDGKSIATCAGNAIHVWDASSGNESQVMKMHEGEVYSIAFSPDGKRIASGGGQTVRVWDVANGKDTVKCKGHSARVIRVEFVDGGRSILSGSWDHTVKIWNAESGQGGGVGKHGNKVLDAAFFPNRRMVASVGADKQLLLWGPVAGGWVQTGVIKHTNSVRSVAVSPDGKSIASCADELIKVWNAATRAELQTLKGHQKNVNVVVFSPGAKRIASGSEDKTVRVWDAATGEPILTLAGHTGRVISLAFSPDGKRVVSGSEDKTAIVWQVSNTAEPAIKPSYEAAPGTRIRPAVRRAPTRTRRYYRHQ
jgi:WD40 repeat protein